MSALKDFRLPYDLVYHVIYNFNPLAPYIQIIITDLPSLSLIAGMLQLGRR